MRLRSQRDLEPGEPRLTLTYRPQNLGSTVATPAPPEDRSTQLQDSDMMLVDVKQEFEDLLESESDDDEDEESDDEQVRQEHWGHDPNAEPSPQHAAFDTALPIVKAHHVASLQKVIDVIKEHSSKSKDVEAMLERAEETVQDVEVRKKVFGFVGDTGMGKSATINSITGVWGLAKSDASGQSCTHVVTIYKHTLDFQDGAIALFAAEIRYLSLDKCREFLSEQLNYYNRYTFEAEEDWDEEQQDEYKSLRDQALALFQALFCDKEAFESPRAACESLHADYNDPNKPALEKFVGWCKDHFANLDTVGNTSVRRYTARTLDDLNGFLEPHVYQKAEVEEPVLCSLIEHVLIGAANSEILKHVDLVDLPGISDINSVRTSIAHREVNNCDGLLVFDQIKRCLTNPALDRILGTYGEQFGLQLTVVITHCDDTGRSDDVIARTIKGEGQSVGDYFTMVQEVRSLEAEIRRLTKRIGKRQSKLAAKSNKDKSVALNILKVQKSEKCLKLQEIKNRKFETLVDARNSNIIRKMRMEKGDYMPCGIQLEVHCISNTHYQSLCDGSAVESLQLDAFHTGVPALRAHLLMLTAPAKLRAIEEMIGKATIFLNGVQMWVEDTPIKQCSGIMEIITEPAQQWSVAVEEYHVSVAAMFTVQLIEPLRDGRISSVTGARDWIKNMCLNWHHSSKLAFFAKNGNHKTKSIGAESWNERFLDVQTTNIIRPQWPVIKKRQRELLTAVVEELIAVLKAIPHRLSQNVNAVFISSVVVRDLMAELALSILRALDTRMEELQAAFNMIKTKSTKDIPEAYFTIAMKSIYDLCNLHVGKGKMKRKFSVLDSDLHPAKFGPFNTFPASLERQLVEMSGTAAGKLQSDVQKLLDQVKEQFQRIIYRKAETPQAKEARRQLGVALEMVKPALSDIVMELQAIKARY